MAERQIRHRKSCLVFSALFPFANWRSRPVAKSAYYALHGDLKQSFAFGGKFLHIVIEVRFTEQYSQTPLKQTLRAS